MSYCSPTMGDNKRQQSGEVRGFVGDDVLCIEKVLPEHVIGHVLEKLELESLCTAACVSTTFRTIVYNLLSSRSSIDLSGISLDEVSLKLIMRRVHEARSLTIDCLQLGDDSCIFDFLYENVEELTLLKCAFLSYDILRHIGLRCPNLRSILVEFAGHDLPEFFKMKLMEMLKQVPMLESLTIKIRGKANDAVDLESLELYLPKNIKKLRLEETFERSFIHLVDKLRDVPWFKLQSLSLVLDRMTDELLVSIANSLPLLVELDLEDVPFEDPPMQLDLTNSGLQCLEVCKRLISLSIVRSGAYSPTPFKRVNNLGMILLSEGCKGLESLRLGGFAKVTEAGFSSILHSCKNLKKFEVLNSSKLSDLAFHDMRGVASFLNELKLISCRLITSEAMEELSSFSNLEVLDTCGCRSIADPCLSYISNLTTLTVLNLAEADITDSGLAVLARGDLPISQLCIRGCKRVTNKGIGFLFHEERKICKTLSLLDIGGIPRISDEAIFTIAAAEKSLTDLCLRYCFFVTDAAVKVLVDKSNTTGSSLQRIDLFNCQSISDDSIRLLLDRSSLRGLHWVGAGCTLPVHKRDGFLRMCNARPWLIVCFDGCEFGCHNGWDYYHNHDRACWYTGCSPDREYFESHF